MDKSIIVNQTRQWVEEVIVGFNFCPFAKPVVDVGGVAYEVVTETSLESCLEGLAEQLEKLQHQPEIETCLVIFPVGYDAFDQYLDLLEWSEALIKDMGCEGEFQLASFHPDYCFEGAELDDAANYTNRSPYPMLHLIREKSIEIALKTVKEPEKIPLRNIEFAREKGQVEMAKNLAKCLK